MSPTHRSRWAGAGLGIALLALVAVGAAAGRGAGSARGFSTYEAATAYTRARSGVDVKRVVRVVSERQLRRALYRIRPGELVKAAKPFTVSGMFRIANLRLRAPAQIDLTGVSFVGDGGGPAAVLLTNDANLRIYGGDVTNRWDKGITVYAAEHVRWWGFSIHDTGGSGLAMLPVDGDITGNDFAGTIRRWGNNPAVDDHEEKGTGLHGAILADAQGDHVFDDNRLALDEADGPTGAGVEIGDEDGSEIEGNTLYLRVRGLTMRPTNQFAANGLEVWGSSRVGLTVRYLEATDLQARAVLIWQRRDVPNGVQVLEQRVRDTCLDRDLCAREAQR